MAVICASAISGTFNAAKCKGADAEGESTVGDF